MLLKVKTLFFKGNLVLASIMKFVYVFTGLLRKKNPSLEQGAAATFVQQKAKCKCNNAGGKNRNEATRSAWLAKRKSEQSLK